MNYCYLNGDITLYEKCKLHISDLLIQRGYGVFDYFRNRGGHIPWLEDYTDRLFNSIQYSGIDCGFTREDFTAIVSELQQKNGGDQTAFKVLVTGGYSDNLENVTGKANVIILHVPWKKPAPESFEKGVHLISAAYQRPNPEIKTLYYFNTLRLQKKMKQYEAVDVLFHHHHITETSRASVFFVKGENVFSTKSDILDGITRKQVLAINEEIEVKDFKFEHLFDVDEMFITSTSRDVTPVVSVDGKKIGTGIPGKITGDIQAAFKAKGW